MIFFYKSSNSENFSTINILDEKHKTREIIIIICTIIAIIYEIVFMVLFFIFKLKRIEFKYFNEKYKTGLIIPTFINNKIEERKPNKSLIRKKTKKEREKARQKRLNDINNFIKKKRGINFYYEDKDNKYFKRRFPTAKEVNDHLQNPTAKEVNEHLQNKNTNNPKEVNDHLQNKNSNNKN